MTFRPVPKPGPKTKARPPTGHPFLAYLHTCPCHHCGTRTNIEAAHVEGPASPKTMLDRLLILPRRKDAAYLAALPLCDHCHRLDRTSIHTLGERNWGIEHYGREDAAARIAFWYLAHWAMTRATV